jgi:serine/threonine-protein kinase
VYAIGGTLYAVAFDARKPKTDAEATPIIEGVRRGWAGNSAAVQLGISTNGTVVYVPGPPGIGASKFDIALTDRKGTSTPLNLQPGMYEYPRVSPDGTRITFDSDDGKEARVWVYRLDGTTSMHELTGVGQNRYPIWTDNRRITFQSNWKGEAAIYWQPADGTSIAERLTTPEANTSHIPDSWAPDSETLAYTVVSGSTYSLWTYSVRERKSAPFGGVQSRVMPTSVFSPDGQWIAYAVGEGADQTQIFVQPFPATGTFYKLFAKAGDGPHHPLWSRDGTELFYIPRFGGFEAVRVTWKPTLIFGKPTPVPRAFPAAPSISPRTFDIAKDGRLVSAVISGLQPSTTASRDGSNIQVVLNWFTELQQRVPTR